MVHLTQIACKGLKQDNWLATCVEDFRDKSR
jgi:hypothetical protein